MPLLWKPLLAATLPPDADLAALPYPLYASPKIDGFRCVVQGGVALTRKGLPLRNKAVQELLGRPEYEGLDGELVIGKPWAADVFNRAQNCVNTGTEAAAEEFRKHGALWVFGWFLRDAEWVNGLRGMQDNLEGLVRKSRSPHVKLVKQTLIKNAAQLAAFEVKCRERGYEGVMLRRGDAGPYPQKPGKENRSTLREFDLVKLKRFEYDTATIVRAHHLEHNANEEKTAAGKRSTRRAGIVVDATRVGSVTLRHKKFGDFSVNVQTEELRAKGIEWWDARRGARVRFKYQVAGTKDKPRIPQCTFAELGA